MSSKVTLFLNGDNALLVEGSYFNLLTNCLKLHGHKMVTRNPLSDLARKNSEGNNLDTIVRREVCLSVIIVGFGLLISERFSEHFLYRLFMEGFGMSNELMDGGFMMDGLRGAD